MLITNYQSTVCNIPDEPRSHVHHWGNLKSCMTQFTLCMLATARIGLNTQYKLLPELIQCIRCQLWACDDSYRWYTNFPKAGNHLKSLVSAYRQVTWSKLHTEYPQTLVATIQKSVTIVMWWLRILHPCLIQWYAVILLCEYSNAKFTLQGRSCSHQSWSNIFHYVSIGASTMVITVKAQYGYEQMHLNTVRAKEYFPWSWMSP